MFTRRPWALVWMAVPLVRPPGGRAIGASRRKKIEEALKNDGAGSFRPSQTGFYGPVALSPRAIRNVFSLTTQMRASHY